MFTTNAPIGFNDQAYKDAALDQNTLPPAGDFHSGIDGFAAQFMAPELGLSELANKISPTLDYALSLSLPLLPPNEIPAGQALSDHLNNIANQNDISGDIGSVAGFALNGLSGELGLAGEGLAHVFGAVGSKILPGVAAKTPGIISGALKLGAAAATAILPSTIPSNYNIGTNSIDWGGVAKTTGIGVGMGMAIGMGLSGLGIAGLKALTAIRSKITENTPESPISTENLQNGLNIPQNELDSLKDSNAITPDVHAALSAYGNKADDQTVQSLGQRVAAKSGVNGDVNITFLKPSDLQNLPIIAGDGLAADIEQPLKSALSDYMLNTNIDDIRSNPIKMAALQGFSDHMEGRLALKSEELSQLDQEADSARSQPVPENPAIANIQDQIKNLSDRLNSLPEDDTVQAPRINRQIDTLGEQLKRANNPVSLEELDKIRSNLTKNDVSPDDLNSSDYYKLNRSALSGNPYANSILNRVNQGAKYNQQAAFKTIADNLLEMNREGIPRQADISKVQDMLKERNGSKTKLIKDEDKLTNEGAKVVKPEDVKAQIDDLHSQGHSSDDLKEATKQYNLADKFKAAAGHLADLVHCLTGDSIE